jgi:CubicO group peptidase (beta-lactamase class C family)
LVFAALLILPLSAQRTKEFKEAVDKIIRYDMEISHEQIPGYIVGLVDGDSTYVASYGSATKDSLVGITPQMVFEIGSLSQVFTMSLFSVLVSEGVFIYEDLVNPLLPQVFRNPNADSLRIHHLISHTSGFDRLPQDFGLRQKNVDDPYAHYTKEDLLVFYASWPFSDWNPQEYRYSHINFALLEIIIENRTGKTYAELLQEKIIVPLGLKNTYISLNEKIMVSAAQGYTVSGRPTAFKTYQSFVGAMGVKSSLEDLLTLIRVYVGVQNQELTDVFTENLKEQAPTGIRKEGSVAYAWHLIKHRRYYNVVSHPGRIGGHQVSLHFVPETRTGTVVLANSDAFMDNLGYMVLALVNNHWRKKRRWWRRK